MLFLEFSFLTQSPASTHNKTHASRPVLICTFAKNSHVMTTILSTILMGAPGPWQIALIVIALLLLFGGRKIPELMRGLGRGIKEFKDATKEEGDEEKEKLDK